MPIEFRCQQCGKLLRTPDDAAGRQAQCPACGGLSDIPTSSTSSEAPVPLAGLRPEASAEAGNPFSAVPPTEETGADANPYHSPSYTGYQTIVGGADPLAAQRVSAPATALLVLAILGLVFQTLAIIINGAQIFLGAGFAPHNELMPMAFGAGINIGVGVIGITVNVVVLLGAIKMKKLENYALAMTAAILALIPCFSACCLLGLPFGIWAIIVLNDPTIRMAFRG